MEKRKYSQAEVLEIMKQQGHRIYYNKNDLNLIVKRPFAINSYTWNFGNNKTFIIHLLILVIMAFLFLLF